MAMRPFAVLAICALLLIPRGAVAQTTEGARLEPTLILSPYYTITDGSQGAFGAAVQWPVARRFAVQAEGEYRIGTPNILMFEDASSGVNAAMHLVWELPRYKRFVGYVLGGGGLEHYVWRDVRSVDPLDLRWHPGNSFVASWGAGARVQIDDRVGVRLEARWAEGWMDGASDPFRLIYGLTIGLGSR
jgi:hypothetical protein